MAQQRKTKQQKMVSQQRKEPIASLATSEAQQAMHGTSNFVPEIENQYAYVSKDLMRIGKISILCLVLLVVATFLFSQISFIKDARAATPFISNHFK